MREILGSPNKQWTAPYSQQGDCPLKKVGIFGVFEKEYADIPADTEEVQGNLVLKGQTNSHALYGGEFVLSKKDDVVFVEVIEPTVLDHVKDHNSGQEHAEHHAQWIPVGQYFYDGMDEFNHLTEESKRIVD